MNLNVKGLPICGAVLIVFVRLFVEPGIAGTTLQKNKRASHSTTRVDQLFKRNCARCHGADGKGDTPLGQVFNTPDFTESEWWRKNDLSDKELAVIVARGKAGMPAFGKKLDKTQINLLVKHVRTFKKYTDIPNER